MRATQSTSFQLPPPSQVIVGMDRAVDERDRRVVVTLRRDGGAPAMLELPRDKAAFLEVIVDEIIAAVSSERSCRCQGNAALRQAEKLRAELPLDLQRAHEAEQLELEARVLHDHAAHHLARVASAKLLLAQHVVYPRLAEP